MTSDLKTLRAEIGRIDDEMLKLLGRRQAVAKQIGAEKIARGLPTKDYHVEKEVLERSRERARSYGLPEEIATELTQLCIRQAVRVQDEQKLLRQPQQAVGLKKMMIIGGLGQMGLWLADFFASFGHEVILQDNRKLSATEIPVRARGFAVQADWADTAAECDVIILATPISVSSALLKELTCLRPKGLIFDICSLKSPLLTAIDAACRAGLRITSVHPMFGPSARLLNGRNILICECGNLAATKEVTDLFALTTAQIATIPLAEHDILMSHVLGLSHLTNLLFARVMAASGIQFDTLLRSASTTFEAQAAVAKPVASENKDLYFEIQVENAHTPEILALLKRELQSLSKAIVNKDRPQFVDLMAECHQFFEGAK